MVAFEREPLAVRLKDGRHILLHVIVVKPGGTCRVRHTPFNAEIEFVAMLDYLYSIGEDELAAAYKNAYLPAKDCSAPLAYPISMDTVATEDRLCVAWSPTVIRPLFYSSETVTTVYSRMTREDFTCKWLQQRLAEAVARMSSAVSTAISVAVPAVAASLASSASAALLDQWPPGATPLSPPPSPPDAVAPDGSHPGWVPKAEPVVRPSEVTCRTEPLVGGPSICVLPGCTRQRFLDGVTGHDTCSHSHRVALAEMQAAAAASTAAAAAPCCCAGSPSLPASGLSRERTQAVLEQYAEDNAPPASSPAPPSPPMSPPAPEPPHVPLPAASREIQPTRTLRLTGGGPSTPAAGSSDMEVVEDDGSGVGLCILGPRFAPQPAPATPLPTIAPPASTCHPLANILERVAAYDRAAAWVRWNHRHRRAYCHGVHRSPQGSPPGRAQREPASSTPSGSAVRIHGPSRAAVGQRHPSRRRWPPLLHRPRARLAQRGLSYTR